MSTTSVNDLPTHLFANLLDARLVINDDGNSTSNTCDVHNTFLSGCKVRS